MTVGTDLDALIAAQTAQITALAGRLDSSLATQAAQITALAGRLDSSVAAETAQAAQITALAGRISKLETPVVVTPPVVPLWLAGMETGNLAEWSGKTNSGSADSVAVLTQTEGIPSRGGLWVMKQSVTGPVGGTRMQRYPEIDTCARAGTPFYYTYWAYFPTKITFGPSDMFQPLGINSTNPQGVAVPVWGLYLNGANFTLSLGWSPNDMAPAEGPHVGETGKRFYSSTVPVPVGQWVKFETYIKPAADFTGAIKVWMNGAVIFDGPAVKTMHPINTLGMPMWIDKDAYGSGLTPTPCVHYVDDVSVSLERML